jgi:hypothetical protein
MSDKIYRAVKAIPITMMIIIIATIIFTKSSGLVGVVMRLVSMKIIAPAPSTVPNTIFDRSGDHCEGVITHALSEQPYMQIENDEVE